MLTDEPPPSTPEGEALLRRLFEMAESRLRQRNITLRYEPSVVGWLLNQPGWRDSLNPLPTLDGMWHQQVASVIENLMIGGQLQGGATLSVRWEKTPVGSALKFDVGTAPRD